ncbi:hypothetical protein Rhow_000708 [Rhodococcus wratislaviensis]|uniref:Uncharacterized protein n=1 Tax=Rhodococcus wratislaviensis TaxID=44752 RepID=A0A402CMU6_RHOWR|nr:hypothetical protein Rhow_000708 [Rhodococcus wratislaviensis]
MTGLIGESLEHHDALTSQGVAASDANGRSDRTRPSRDAMPRQPVDG